MNSDLLSIRNRCIDTCIHAVERGLDSMGVDIDYVLENTTASNDSNDSDDVKIEDALVTSIGRRNMNATGDDGDSSEELLALYAHFQQATELTNANYDELGILIFIVILLTFFLPYLTIILIQKTKFQTNE